MRRLEVFKNLEKSFRSIQIYEETVPIHLAVLNGQEELVQAAIDARVDVNLKRYISGETPLHLAVLFNYQNIVRTLIKNQANINDRCNELETPLHKAVNTGNQEIVQLLCKMVQIPALRI